MTIIYAQLKIWWVNNLYAIVFLNRFLKVFMDLIKPSKDEVFKLFAFFSCDCRFSILDKVTDKIICFLKCFDQSFVKSHTSHPWCQDCIESASVPQIYCPVGSYIFLLTKLSRVLWIMIWNNESCNTTYAHSQGSPSLPRPPPSCITLQEEHSLLTDP